jgi:hypothetical protein
MHTLLDTHWMFVGFGCGRLGCGDVFVRVRSASGRFVFGLGVVWGFGLSRDGPEEGIFRIGRIAMFGSLQQVCLGIFRASEGPSFILNEFAGGGVIPMYGVVFGVRAGRESIMDWVGFCHGGGLTM